MAPSSYERAIIYFIIVIYNRLIENVPLYSLNDIFLCRKFALPDIHSQLNRKPPYTLLEIRVILYGPVENRGFGIAFFPTREQ